VATGIQSVEEGSADWAHATPTAPAAGRATTPADKPSTAAAAAAAAAMLPTAEAAAESATTPVRVIAKAIVPVEVPDLAAMEAAAATLPMPGEPLWVTQGVGKYRGSVVNRLALPGEPGHFAGVVLPEQPAQTMAHRDMMLVAVTTEGSVGVAAPGTPGAAYMLDGCGAGVYVTDHTVVLTATFSIARK
jgi:hypothetical protein